MLSKKGIRVLTLKSNKILPKSKRSLSDVVVSLIMILLVLVAIGVVWVVVSGILKSSSEEADISGLMIDMKVTEVLYDNVNLNIKVSRGTGAGDVAGVVFYLEGNGKSIPIEKPGVIEQLGEKTFTNIGFSGITISEIEKISVAPIYKLKSGNEKTGNIIDIAVLSCEGPLISGGLQVNPQILGTVKSFGKIYTDYCVQSGANGVLAEYYCSNKVAAKTSAIACPVGIVNCVSGVCVA